MVSGEGGSYLDGEECLHADSLGNCREISDWLGHCTTHGAAAIAEDILQHMP